MTMKLELYNAINVSCFYELCYTAWFIPDIKHFLLVGWCCLVCKWDRNNVHHLRFINIVTTKPDCSENNQKSFFTSLKTCPKSTNQ